MATIRHEVESLGLDVGGVHHLPLEVIAGELGMGRLIDLVSDRADGGGPVDGLLGAGHIGQPGFDASVSITRFEQRSRTGGKVYLLLFGPVEHDEYGTVTQLCFNERS